MNPKAAFESRAEVLVDPLAIHDPRVTGIIRYVAAHYDESLTLNFLSKKFDCTPEHLSRLLAARGECGFRNLCQKVRMAHAGILLEQGFPIKVVYRQCGYKSLSKFYRCFKRIFHMTPGQYQKYCRKLHDPEHWMLWGIERVELAKGKRKTKEVKRELLVGRFR